MIRLWNRVGMFRALSALVLLVGILGASLVATDRQTQQRSTASTAQAAPPVVPETVPDPVADQADAQRKADEAATAAAEQAKAAEDEARKKQPASRGESRPTGKPGAPVGPIPSSCQQQTGNRAIGCTLMLQWGYGLDQFPCLEKLWTKESGWNVNSRNPRSGAGGIPQANPASKMSAYGADWATNPATQIRWGLDYIKGRYKTPCGAWANFQADGWY